MKKIVYLSLIAMSITLLACASCVDIPINKPCQYDSQNVRVVNVLDLNDQTVHDLRQGQHPDIAVEFTKGTTLPISFLLKGDLITFVEKDISPGHIEIQQTFYARSIQNELMISTDLSVWKPFQEFITGNISAGFGIHSEQACITVGAEINQRT